VAKQWCVLCLGVQALLLLGGINILTNNFLLAFPIVPASFFINAALIYLLPVLLWFTAKPSLLHLQEGKNTKREYLRIKFNTEIFETLLKKQKQITLPVDSLGIDIGNPTAANTLIKVCNPYCGPCSETHPKIEKLLGRVSNLKLKIIFSTTSDYEDLSFKAGCHLMAISEEADQEIMKQALDDWYLADKKDLKLFAEKYPMNGEIEKQQDKVRTMRSWCRAQDIFATPTFFINGYNLPDAYHIEDLQYFLLE
jgi:hypothetical protein